MLFEQNPESMLKIRNVFYSIKFENDNNFDKKLSDIQYQKSDTKFVPQESPPIDENPTDSDYCSSNHNNNDESIQNVVNELEGHGNIISKEFSIDLKSIKIDEIWSNFYFPLKSSNQLELLEFFLFSNKEFRSEFIRNFSFVSSSTRKTKFGFANALASALFDNKLLEMYCWTRCECPEKELEFKAFVEIFAAFHEIVSSSDIMYTADVTKEFICEFMLNEGRRNKRRF